MAVGRAAIWEGIYQTLLADTVLLAILGPVTRDNLRLYRSFPQWQSTLTSYEPLGDEGWMLIDEPEPNLRAAAQQLESSWEVVEPTFTIVATRFSLCDDVSDRIDLAFLWTVEQQRELVFGERIVLFTRRYSTKDDYDKETKLYRKTLTYKMDLVVEEQLA
jgi:hypothetical protein